jgi:flagellar L-ring protein precursor FlgH
MKWPVAAAAWGCLLAGAASADGQSNSLFKSGKVAASGEATIRTVSLSRVTTSSDRDFKKHDLITIVIREQTKSKTVADSETDKKTSLQAIVSAWPKFIADGVVKDVAPVEPTVAKVSAERDFEGGGSKQRDDLFVERLAAEIVDIKPNGTLVVEATKQRTWMGEVQILTVTGVVRKEDVAEDNTVTSDNIANLCLSYETRGQVSTSARRGLLDWLLDLVNIF